MGEHGHASYVFFEEKYGLSALLNRAITVTAPAGIAIGSIFGPSILSMSKVKLWKLTVFFNVMAIVFNILKLFENYVAYMIGRYLAGICAGISQLFLQRFLRDTVPVQHSQVYGMSVNIGYNLGIFFAYLFSGLIIPLKEDVDLKENEAFRVVYGLPILAAGVSIFFTLMFFRDDTVKEVI